MKTLVYQISCEFIFRRKPFKVEIHLFAETSISSEICALMGFDRELTMPNNLPFVIIGGVSLGYLPHNDINRHQTLPISRMMKKLCRNEIRIMGIFAVLRTVHGSLTGDKACAVRFV